MTYTIAGYDNWKLAEPNGIEAEDTRQCAFCDAHIPVETKTDECPVCLEEDNELSPEKKARLEANKKAFAEMLKREGLA